MNMNKFFKWWNSTTFLFSNSMWAMIIGVVILPSPYWFTWVLICFALDLPWLLKWLFKKWGK